MDTPLLNRLQRLSSSIPGVLILKRQLRQNTTACGMTYWLSTIGERLGFKVLTYHRILEQANPYYSHCIPAPLFEAQARMFSRFCAVLSLDEIVARLERGQDLPRRCIALTFDDGYRDTATLAAPILARYQLPATVYVAVDAVERGTLWPDLLRYALRQTIAHSLELDTLRDGGTQRFDLSTPKERVTTVYRLGARMKRLPNAQRLQVVQEVSAKLLGTVPERVAHGPAPMLSWDDIRSLQRQGITIGAHTISHPILSRMSEHDAWHEIMASRQILQQKLGVNIRHFAYPNGQAEDFSPTIMDMVEQAGFVTAVTTVHGVNQPGEDRMALKRIDGTMVSLRALVSALVEHDVQ